MLVRLGLADRLAPAASGTPRSYSCTVDLAVAAHLDPAPLGERVDDRGADAVQTAGDLVAAAAELAAGVQDGHDDFQRRLVHLGVHVDRDAAAVVDAR